MTGREICAQRSSVMQGISEIFIKAICVPEVKPVGYDVSDENCGVLCPLSESK